MYCFKDDIDLYSWIESNYLSFGFCLPNFFTFSLVWTKPQPNLEVKIIDLLWNESYVSLLGWNQLFPIFIFNAYGNGEQICKEVEEKYPWKNIRETESELKQSFLEVRMCQHVGIW